MKKAAVLLLLFSLLIFSCDQPLTAEKILDKSITYHDPNGNWNTFKGELNITMKIPDQSDRISEIRIDLPEEGFYVKATRETTETIYDIKKDDCIISFNGQTNFSEEVAKVNRLDCETAKRYQNYYTYLYGLPMKLKDPGTHISDSLITKNFKGKDYLVLKTTYDESVGSDIWYFYFDPETYAMEVYQFFRKDDEGRQNDDTGEYILLSEEVLVNDIKMPKIRAWYYNKDDKYLGTDVLN